MTIYTSHLVIGRPVSGLRDWGDEYVLATLGVENPEEKSAEDLVPGLDCMYQGEAFIGVRVRRVLGQSFGPVAVEKLDLSIPPEKEAEARRLCDALPEGLKNHPRLMPFGAYLLGSNG